MVVQDTEVDYSNVLTLGDVEIAIGDSSGAKKALPPGTKRNVFRGYEVVDVPALDPGRLLPPPQLVQIGVLEDWAQTAFKGYKTLNRIQSQIFQARCSVRGNFRLFNHVFNRTFNRVFQNLDFFKPPMRSFPPSPSHNLTLCNTKAQTRIAPSPPLPPPARCR